jgi:hypothetical protein
MMYIFNIYVKGVLFTIQKSLPILNEDVSIIFDISLLIYSFRYLYQLSNYQMHFVLKSIRTYVDRKIFTWTDYNTLFIFLLCIWKCDLSKVCRIEMNNLYRMFMSVNTFFISHNSFIHFRFLIITSPKKRIKKNCVNEKFSSSTTYVASLNITQEWLIVFFIHVLSVFLLQR